MTGGGGCCCGDCCCATARPTRPFCRELRSRSRFRLCRSAAFCLLCRWLGDSFSRDRFPEEVGIVGSAFWGVEGCNAGSIRGSKEIYWETVVKSLVTDPLLDELVQGF